MREHIKVRKLNAKQRKIVKMLLKQLFAMKKKDLHLSLLMMVK